MEKNEQIITRNVYVVVDKVADDSCPCFEAKNDQTAIRQVCDMMYSGGVANIGDYDLVQIGVVEKNGQLTFIPNKGVVEWHHLYDGYKAHQIRTEEFYRLHKQKTMEDFEKAYKSNSVQSQSKLREVK